MQNLQQYTGLTNVLQVNTGLTFSTESGLPPFQIGNLAWWFSSSSVEFNGSNIITDLIDKTGNITLTNIDGSPTYQATDSAFNNRPSVRNQANLSQGYDINGFNHTENGGYTMFFVIKRDTTGTRSLFDSQTPRFAVYNYHTTSSRYAWSDGTTLFSFGSSAPNTNLHIVTFVFDSGTGESKCYEDGVLLGTQSYSAKNIGGATSFLKRPDPLGGSVSFGGYWAEGLFYTQPKTKALIDKVGRYLANLYNITYTSG